MLTKIHGDAPVEVMRHLEAQHGEVSIRALTNNTKGLQNRLSLVEQLKPNALSDDEINQIARMREWQEDLKQNPLGFVWIATLSGVSGDNTNTKHGFGGLEAHYSIICLNDDKEILSKEDIDAYNLAEMIQEASPYLVLIPKAEATIPMSTSS